MVLSRSPISMCADHINRICNLIGTAHVGIGADYDGVQSSPDGLEDVSKCPEIFNRLYNSKTEPRWTKEDLEKLADKNLIRVFEGVETVRDSLAAEFPRENIISGMDLYNAELDSNVKPVACNTAIE